MKYGPFMLFFVVIILSLVSCRRADAILSAAEVLMEEYPDSALALLCSIESPRKFSTERYALYSLLLTQALDKCDYDLSEDTLIVNAVDYYQSSLDSAHAAKAFFYAGRVAEEMGYAVRAVDYFLEAKSLMKSSCDYKYRFLVRNNLGLLYAEQWLRCEQLEVYREAVVEASAAENQAYLALAWHGVGVAFSGLHQADSALCYQERALFVARTNQLDLLPEIYHHISRIYLGKNELRLAICYVDSVLQYSTDDPVAYVTKGHILFNPHCSLYSRNFLISSRRLFRIRF